jgi:hypothetical protein
MKDKIIKVLTAPFRFFFFLLDRALAAAGAVIFAQFPSFIVQYQQRMGGHVDELQLIISRYSEAAARNSKTIEEYISIHMKSEISDFVSSGIIMTENLARHKELSRTLAELTESSGILKLLTFVKTLNYDIFQKTLDNFTPGISFNIDTLVYSLAGIIFIMSIYFLIKKSLQILAETIRGSSTKRDNPGE